MPVHHHTEEGSQRFCPCAWHGTGIGIDEDRLFAPKVDDDHRRRIGSQHYTAWLTLRHRGTGPGHQGIEIEARHARCGWLHRADMALGKGDNLALEGQQHAGHGHHENNQAGHDPRHEVQPEDDLAQR
jgi:hypothetical protein